jgi:hypothetical protein
MRNSGEFWIHEDGSTDFADGDVGDYNHEGIVVRDVQRQVIDACESKFDIEDKRGSRFSNFDEYVDWDGFKSGLANAYAKELIEKYPEKREKIEEELENDPDRYMMAALKRAGIKKAEWDVANGMGDARDYAMEKWGWKTYRDGHIDTWRITRSDLQAIIRGIEDIADDNGWSDKRLARMSFTITVFSNRKQFNLTFEQMERWLASPSSAVPPTQQGHTYDYLTPQADKQIRDMEIQKMHPAYNRPGVNPFGDSVISSFRNFLRD